jgi:tetratricopeptide (TPR) repeat protein
MNPILDRAIQYRLAGQFLEAHALLSEILAENPNDPQANCQMAWLCDTQGREREAVPYYVKALETPEALTAAEWRGSLLGLGSTYRTLGEYDNAIATLERGIATFPNAGEFPLFLAMAFYNVGRHADAMQLLLQSAADSSNDSGIQRYARAIRFYSDKLDEVWT